MRNERRQRSGGDSSRFQVGTPSAAAFGVKLSRVTLRSTIRGGVDQGNCNERKPTWRGVAAGIFSRPLLLLLIIFCVASSRSQTAPDNRMNGGSRSNASSVEHVLAEAQSAALDRHYPQAIKLLRAGLNQNPGNLQLQLELGRSFLAIGQDGKAERLFRETLKTKPGDRETELELARCRAYQGHLEESNELYRSLLRINPADEAAAIGLVGNLLHQGRRAEAASVADAGLAYHANSLRLLEYRDRIASGLMGADERSLPLPGNVFAVDTEFVTDSAGNHSWRGTERLEFKIRPGLTSDLHLEEQFLHSLDNPLDVVQVFSETLRWRPREKLGLSLGGGGVRFDNGDVSAIYDTTLTKQVGSRLLIGAGFSRIPILPDAEAAEYRITAQGWEAFGLWAPNGWQVNARASRRHFTDGNVGGLEGMEAVHQWMTPKINYVAGFRFRHYDFSENLAHGYFSPDNYQSYQGGAGFIFHPNRKYRGELTARLGGESIASGAPFQAAWEVTTRNQLTLGHWELGLDYSRYHMAQATGAFRADAARFEFAYHF